MASVEQIERLIAREARRFILDRHVEPALVAFAHELVDRYEHHELQAMRPHETTALASAFFRRYAADRFEHSLSCN